MTDHKEEQSASREKLERLRERNAALNMLAYQWMAAHDALAAGKPYEFPSPVDLPECIKRAEAAESRCKVLAGLLEKALGWLSYAEDCDEFYFSEEQAPGFAKFRAEARKALGDHQ